MTTSTASEFTFHRAVRQGVRLLISLAGGTGSGKTKSLMMLAKGLAGDQRFAVIDSENGRASMYAPPDGQPAKYPDTFDFDVIEIHAPYTSERYQAAIEAAEAAGYPVIVVDQMSHEYEGDGGILDRQEEELAALVAASKKRGDTREEWKLEEAHNMRAWNEAKAPHKKLVSKITQLNAHLLVGLRADDKIEIVKEGNKTVIRPKQTLTGSDGWVPICEKKFPFEVTASFLLVSSAPGIPKSIKKGPWRQEINDIAFPAGKPITEESGRILGEWAKGGTPKVETKPTEPAQKPTVQETKPGVKEPVGQLPLIPAIAPIADVLKRIGASSATPEDWNWLKSLTFANDDDKNTAVSVFRARKKQLNSSQSQDKPAAAQPEGHPVAASTAEEQPWI